MDSKLLNWLCSLIDSKCRRYRVALITEHIQGLIVLIAHVKEFWTGLGGTRRKVVGRIGIVWSDESLSFNRHGDGNSILNLSTFADISKILLMVSGHYLP